MEASLSLSLLLLLALLITTIASAAPPKSALGTTPAVDALGNLWIAYAEGPPATATIYVSRFNAAKTWDKPIAVNSPEPVSADGENRPKLVFGPRGQMYVTWTSPTSANYTGDIRFARSLDGGKTWTKSTVVHRDRQLITHRFESVLVDRDGTIWVTWIDKRDLQSATAAKRDYAGAAIYYAYSKDQGSTWQGDFKLADHSCECCRIALSTDANGQVAALWRHVFDGERDHAFAYLTPNAAPHIQRATFDRWKIDACPHHGPSLAFAANGSRHAVWFNQVEEEGRAFYGQLGEQRPANVKRLPESATHPDIAITGDQIAIAWKRFDGEATRIESWLSLDAGKTFTPGPSLSTPGESDQPRLISVRDEIVLVWRRTAGVAVQSLVASNSDKPSAQPRARDAGVATTMQVKPFDRDTLKRIERERRGQAFWLVLWDLECTYCMKSLKRIAHSQRQGDALGIITVSTDPLEHADALRARLQELGVQSEAYAFSNGTPEALRYAIDPKWMGEKPRAYLYAPDGTRRSFSGVMSEADVRSSATQ